MDAAEGGPAQNLVKFQTVTRLNAIMVVSSRPELLRTAATWIARLDKTDTASAGVKVYRVKYGDAKQLAGLLNDIFIGRSCGRPRLAGEPDRARRRPCRVVVEHANFRRRRWQVLRTSASGGERTAHWRRYCASRAPRRGYRVRRRQRSSEGGSEVPIYCAGSRLRQRRRMAVVAAPVGRRSCRACGSLRTPPTTRC